jgi:hypothetical protein
MNASGCVLLRKAEKGKGNFLFLPFLPFSFFPSDDIADNRGALLPQRESEKVKK